MDLFGALSNAFNGLNHTQDALSVVSQNVAGANQAGYVRREYVGQTTNGITPSVQRVLDSYVQKQLWSETSSSGYTSVQADYTKQLDGIYGDPTGASQLSSSIDNFKNTLNTLQNNPSGGAEQSTVLSAASDVALRLTSMSSGIQNLRSGTEEAIAQSVTQADTLLKQLATLNSRIKAAGPQNNLDLLDNRDAALSQLSNLMAINVTELPDGSVNLTNRSGTALVTGQQASDLSFDSHAPLTATNLYSIMAGQSGVGTITVSGNGSSTNLLSGDASIGGQIGGLIELRDKILPNAQSQLDDIGAGVSLALSNRSVSSSSIAGGLSLDTTGIQPGNRMALTFTDSSGTVHQVTMIRVDDASKLPLADNATADANDKVIGVAFSGGLASAVSDMQAGLNAIGAGITVSASTVPPGSNIVSFTASGTASVNALSATITNMQIQGQGNALPFFIDSATGLPYTGSFDVKDQRIGIASRLQINQALTVKPSALADATGTSISGDPMRAKALVSQLMSQTVEVHPESGLSVGSATTVSNLVKQVFQTQANLTNRLASLDSSQSVVLASVQGRFNKSSSVNMDEELTNLTALQNVYAANAKVMTTIREMFTVLMQL
ncbi:MAG: flagellar hook-associated protein FlgK [Beijerinckiaceae bacterium]|nr:flagellar hook-associated protein FlgK [Beijerinckiaceae bacterium]